MACLMDVKMNELMDAARDWDETLQSSFSYERRLTFAHCYRDDAVFLAESISILLELDDRDSEEDAELLRLLDSFEEITDQVIELEAR